MQVAGEPGDAQPLPGMQAEAARTFAGVLASTGFNPVEANR